MIPRSGEEGEKVNCFVVALNNQDGSPFFMAADYEDGILLGLKWDGHSYAEKHSIQFSDIKNFNVTIKHYYGLSTIRYHNIYAFAWNYFTKIVYIKIHLARIFSSIGQYLFNKKKLITKNRMELLHFMLEDQISREHDSIGVIDLMTKLYSIKWVMHPSSDDQEKKLEIYLDSLVESGDLRKVNHKYVVTGKAISTLERYEEEERRHDEILKLQCRMVWLTVILVTIGLLQAGLVKLPTLLDFSNAQKHNKSIHTDGNSASLVCHDES